MPLPHLLLRPLPLLPTPTAMTCAEIALHLANHATYHRGYIAGMFFEMPAHPPTTDLTVFIRDEPLQLE